MLAELTIENFGLLERIHLTFGPGFSVFTGETGAGKSMLIDALTVLLGGRASTDMIRYGAEKAKLEGVFTELPPGLADRLEEAGYPAEDGQLFLFRELNASGRHLCRVQGRAVPLVLYRELCAGLVDIHGQLEHQSLLQSRTQRELLDALGGSEHMELLAQVSKAALAYREVVERERRLLVSEAERERRMDFLRYQIEEIEQVGPVAGEEELLNDEKRLVANAERLTLLVADAYAHLYQGSPEGRAAYDALGRVRKDLLELTRLDPSCGPLVEQLDNAYYAVEELAEAVRTYRERLDFEPGRVDAIEERLAKLRRLHKYGANIEEVLQACAAARIELEQLTHAVEQLAALGKDKEYALGRYHELAGRLTERRLAQAQDLAVQMTAELKELGMDRGRLEVRLVPLNEPTVGGSEEVEFWFTANLGEPPKPLAKVASGGEMARLMLALKSLLAKVETVDTFVFDEVDSGVGGRTIRKVGEKLARIAASKQVLCITHAAHVAAYADRHFGLTKEVAGERTFTRVRELHPAERVEELARMLGSQDGEIARRHAEELWKEAHRQVS